MTDGTALDLRSGSYREMETIPRGIPRDIPGFPVSLKGPEPCRRIVHDERSWRRPDILKFIDQQIPRFVVSRWRGMDRSEHAFEIAGEYHLLAIALQRAEFSLHLGESSFPHQEVAPGTIQISSPGLPARIVHSGPYDLLHLHVPNQLLTECFEWLQGKQPSGGIALRDPMPDRDTLLLTLGSTLMSIADVDDPNSFLSADFVTLAIITHLLRHYGDFTPPTARRTVALSKWRLKRATEFIEAHLDSQVALAHIAGAVGLSRMHFAAQFRAATGVRPHEYVLRRRIEKAQSLLATSDMPIVELALAIGFSSQAHFSVVFKRYSGMTPGRWRQSRHA